MSVFYTEITCKDCICNNCLHASNADCDPCETCTKSKPSGVNCKGYTPFNKSKGMH